MRVLITGAEGFVGSHLAPELTDVGHEVIATDRADTDLALPWKGYGLIEAWRPDAVVHLAARYGRLLCRDEPHCAVADNAAATTEIARTCAELGIPVLYASSSEVYGDHGPEPITEESELRMPTTIYGLSKRWGEEALRLYMRPEQLTIVRMNMLYGPRQQAGYGRCALATFVEAALAGETFVVHRGTSRSWLYIADAVRALRALLERGISGIWNLGNAHDRRSMEELARLVMAETAGGGAWTLVDLPPGQIAHKVYDSSKLERALRWYPATSLERGLRETVEVARGERVRDDRRTEIHA